MEEFVERFWRWRCNATAPIVNTGGGEEEAGMKRERQMLEGNGESKGKWENRIVKSEPKKAWRKYRSIENSKVRVGFHVCCSSTGL